MLKIRCSQIYRIMTDPRSKKAKEDGELSETTKTYLQELWIEKKYGRRKEVKSKYLEKGNEKEEASITLLSNVSGKLFFKNEQFYENDFLTGTPDIVKPELIDIKTSWDIHTFFSNHTRFGAVVDKNYKYQLQGYMALTDAPSATLVYCLVNTPVELAEKEMQWNGKTAEDVFFDDIPEAERVITQTVERDEKVISDIYSRIENVRRHWDKLCA